MTFQPMRTVVFLWFALCCAAPTVPAEEPGGGRVQLPLEIYTRLIEAGRDPGRTPAPTGYALGNARITIQVAGTEPRAGATIQVQLGIEVLEDEWVLVPVLPPGTPVDSASVGGKPVQLVSSGEALAWSVNRAGSYTMNLTYKADAARYQDGYTLSVPVPRAAAIQLSATLPGSGLDASVIPAAGVQVSAAGGSTRVTATVPTTSGILVSWRTPGDLAPSISRAVYKGRLDGESVRWTGELEVELFSDETAVLQLLPASVTLDRLELDGKEATILVEQGRFATVVRGRGRHRVTVGLQVPVQRESGPPRVDLQIPRVPVSRFDLTLPGKAELTVLPASNVTARFEKGSTTATAHVAMTDRVSFAWSEAIPEELRTELRVNAATYHAVHASEGVLYVHAKLDYEVSRGETNRIELLLPPDVQVDRIDSGSGAVSDWRVGESGEDGRRVVTIFLDRQLRGSLLLDVHYDRSLSGEIDLDRIEVPLIRPTGAQRQRGMVALLAGRELTLNPVDEGGATRVGENQLPPFVREALEMTVAHTFKYTEQPPRLLVAAAVPERVAGKFDALVDTLVSLGDVTLAGSSSVALNLKSGRITALQLELPADVNLLSLSAPSLRTHRVTADGGKQIVDVEFTQELEGQFRIEITYERIMAAEDPEVRVPTVSVRGAEVEQGRIAVEALSAVEVRLGSAGQLSPLDVNELPRQLLLRTTNPILLAYKYVHAEPAPELVLQVTRHALIPVQEAAIDRADYRTLFTVDGLVVTTVRFTVRNSRKQFLRMELPGGSEVWSAFVDGKAEKPALGEELEGSAARPVLVKIINSAEPFPVELVYATPGRRIGHLGTVEGILPRPDILVTHSHWDVYLPDGYRYAEPRSNMELVEGAQVVTRQIMAAEFSGLDEQPAPGVTIEPLRITVPASGVRYAFEKLYANQTDRVAWFRVPYASAGGRMIGRSISLAGVALLWLGIGLRLRREAPVSRRMAAGIGLAGLAAVIVAIRVYHAGLALPLAIFVLAGLAVLLVRGRHLLGGWRNGRVPEGA